MPYPRVCFYCKKTFMTSTYGMIHHVANCAARLQEKDVNAHSDLCTRLPSPVSSEEHSEHVSTCRDIEGKT